jgi:hypothetical protein
VINVIAFAGLIVLAAQLGWAATAVAVVGVALQLVFVVVLSRVVLAWIGAAMRSRRGRDLGVVLAGLAGLACYPMSWLLSHVNSAREVPWLSDLLRRLPSGWVPSPVAATARRDWLVAVVALAGLMVVSAALWQAWSVLLRRRAGDRHPYTLLISLVLPGAIGRWSMYPWVLSLLATVLGVGAGAALFLSVTAPYPMPLRTGNPLAGSGNPGCAKGLLQLMIGLGQLIAVIPVLIVLGVGWYFGLTAVEWFELPIAIGVGAALLGAPGSRPVDHARAGVARRGEGPLTGQVASLGAAAQDLGGLFIGGQERFQMELSEGDVDGGGERGDGRDQLELTVRAAQPQRHREAEMVGAWMHFREIAFQLGDELVEARVGAAHSPAAQALGDVPAPVGQIHHAPGQPVRMQREAQHVDRRLEQFRRGALGEHVERGIRGEQLAVGPHDDRGVGQVPVQDALQRGPHRTQFGGVQIRFGEDRGETGGQQQPIAFAQRQSERFG